MERRVWQWRGAAVLVLVLVGVLLVASARLAGGTDLRAERRTELTELITAEDARVTAATHQVEQLRREVDEVTSRLEGPMDPEDRAGAERVTAAAGLSEVRGPGLSVSLTDAPIPVGGIPDGYAPDDYVVHQSDVQSVINALWAGGAEAIQVMDQRIIATSAVRCVGNTLILKGRVYAPPYVVAAVGPPERLQRALDASPGVFVYRQYVDLVGLGYDVEESDQVVVAAYEGSLELRYAQAAS